jgi:hypothetical protein
MVKLSACSHFQNDVDIRIIVKAAVHLDDVGMVKEHLNFNLSDELVSYLLLVQEFLLYHLQRAYKIAVLLFHKVHSSVFTVS